MFTKSITAAAVALGATLVSAQTHTSCQPLTQTCKPDPAFGNDKVNCDFTSGACSDFTLADGTTLSYGSNGAEFSISTAAQAPTINTGKYLFFGRIDIEVMAAQGKGIVTSAVLQSDDLDEIDWEWVGADNTQAQSNYFFQGQTGNYDRGAFHTVSTPLTSFHTYSVEWTQTAINWIIDGNTVRTLLAADAHGVDGFPQTPMQVKLGTWVGGGPNSPQGTVEWAGGLADFSQAPFVGYYKSVAITDYAGGNGPTSESVKEYIYGDHSGTWQSIKVVAGDGSSSGDSSSSSSSAAATTTSAKPTTSSKAHSTTSAAATTTSSEEASKTHTSAAAATTSSSAAPTTMASATNSPAPSTTSAAVKPSSTDSGAGQNGVAAGAAVIAGAVMFALF